MGRRIALAAAGALSLAAPFGGAHAAGPSVLLVGPAGTPGAQYESIQAAVDAAAPGDWVLVAPGVYHEKGSDEAGVLIQKPGIHLRGMDRNQVIVDGTRFSAAARAGTAPAGSAACSSQEADQDITAAGMNGVEAKGFTGSIDSNDFVGHLADDVWIENLTVCNYLTGDEGGNEIWWNGGDGQGLIGMSGLYGDYLNATSTYIKTSDGPAGQYGIFTSNEDGTGVIDHSYASNFRDSAYYVGACRDCNVVLNHAHAENSALGLSSTNAGGNLLVENSEWDYNRTGLVSNAQNNDDFPSPEYGQCVPPSVPPTLNGISAGPNSCYVMFNNFIHHNNNPNIPGAGLTAVSAVGTGVELAATQHISVIGNRIEDNGAWGVVTHDFPDPESGPANCVGGVDIPAVPAVSPEVCYWYSLGNYVSQNAFKDNGGFGNPTNGDVANQGPGAAKAPSDSVGTIPDPNCYSADTDTAGVTAWPVTLETTPCVTGPTNSETLLLTAQLLCSTGATSLFTEGTPLTAPPCPEGASYPQHDGVCGTPTPPATP
ncbi:MAG: hypothetical protein QOE92_2439 [Chloroflexota bacterium]|jgi:hypothetical protein|nr:hypothetical protein [Chloroflexota bacterium]